MTQALSIENFGINRFATIRDILDLIRRIGDIGEPITTPEGLGKAIEILLRFAELVGIDPEWTDKLRTIVKDENVFLIVLAIVRFVLGMPSRQAAPNEFHVLMHDGGTLVVDAQSFLQWLPVVLQIISLIRQIRGGK